MTVSDFFTNYSKLTARQPGVWPVSGPLPSAVIHTAAGAGLGYGLGKVLGSVLPGFDKKKLKRTLAIGGAGAGLLTSIPDLTTANGMFDAHPYGPEQPTVTPTVKTAAYKFNSTQIDLTGLLRAKALNLARSIPREELSEEGRETKPHVTVLYGLHKSDADSVKQVLAKKPAGNMTVGGLSLFTNDRRHDVLKADINSPLLQELHESLKQLPHTSKFKDYAPHMTIAYLKKGMGKKYVGKMDLAGEQHPVDRVTFSSTDESRTAIPLSPVVKSTVGATVKSAVEQSGTHSLKQLVKEAAEKRALEADVLNLPGFGPVSYTPIPVGSAAQMLLADKLMNPLQRAMTFQVLQDASQQQPTVTTGSLVRAAVGAGLGYVGGNLVGRFMGAVFGVPPALQHRVAQVGALGGLLNAVGVLE